MYNTKLVNNSILFTRSNELLRITPCHDNAIRFEAFPDCREYNESFTLMPQSAKAEFEDKDYCVFMRVGKLKIQLERNGKLTFYNDEKVIIEEKEELAFHDGYRNYVRKDGLWSARITFKSNEGEHFYGLGHEATDKFDLKGCSFDLRHVNAKCTIPFVFSSLGYGFLWNNPSTQFPFIPFSFSTPSTTTVVFSLYSFSFREYRL